MSTRRAEGRRGGRKGTVRPVLAAVAFLILLVGLSCAGCGAGAGLHSPIGRFTPNTLELDACAGEVPVLVGVTTFTFSDVVPGDKSCTIRSIGPSLMLREAGSGGGVLEIGDQLDDDQEVQVWATSTDFLKEYVEFKLYAENDGFLRQLTDSVRRTSVTVRNTCPDAPEPEPEPVPEPTPTRIVFSSDRDGDTEIFSMAEDGSDLVQLTDDAWENTDPALSPDGTRIVFLSTRDALPGYPGLSDLWMMEADGSDPRRLTYYATDGTGLEDPAWSPDGHKIAFAGLDLLTGIHVLDLDTDRTRWIAREPGDVAPTWSPDGMEVAFQRGTSIYLAEDVEPWRPAVPLLDHATADGQPDWTVNGWEDTAIAYVSEGDLYVTKEPDMLVPLVTGGGVRAPAWAPVVDGQPSHRIVYVRNDALFVVDTVTRDRTPLGEVGADPDWGPEPP